MAMVIQINKPYAEAIWRVQSSLSFVLSVEAFIETSNNLLWVILINQIVSKKNCPDVGLLTVNLWTMQRAGSWLCDRL